MIWLALSILCSTLIFVVFKLYARFNIHNLQAIVFNYVVAFAVGYFTSDFEPKLLQVVEKDWFSSAIILGSLFISLFQLMALVSQKFGVAAVSVAVKMSLVIPVLFAVSYYDESLGVLKITGIIMALAAVYMATHKPSRTRGHITLIFLPIILFLASGFLDAFIKYNQQELVPVREHGYFTSLLFLVAGAIGIIWYVVLWLSAGRKPEWRSLLGGLALGVPNYGSIFFLLKALEIKNLEASVLFPVNNVGIVALSVICGKFLFNEKLSVLNTVGIILALISIGIMTMANFI